MGGIGQAGGAYALLCRRDENWGDFRNEGRPRLVSCIAVVPIDNVTLQIGKYDGDTRILMCQPYNYEYFTARGN